MSKLISLSDLERFTGITTEEFQQYIASGKLVATGSGSKTEVTEQAVLALSGKLIDKANDFLDRGLGGYPEDRFASHRSEDLYKAANCFGFAGDLEKEKEVTSLAILARFTKANVAMNTHALSEWGRFAPVATGEREDGSTVASPDPSQISNDDVLAVAKYKEQSSDLEFKALCADFLFEKGWGTGKSKYENFRFASQAYITLASEYLKKGPDWRHRLVDALARSLQIAFITNQASLEAEAKKAHFDAIDALMRIEDFRYVLEIAKSLHLQARALTDDEKERLITTLDDIAKHYGEQGGQNRYMERSFLRQKREVMGESVKATATDEIVMSFFRETEETGASGFEKLYLTEGALAEIPNSTLNRSAVSRLLNARLSEGTREAVASFQPIEYQFEVPHEEIEECLREAIGETPANYLKVLSRSSALVPSREEAARYFDETAKQAPLLSLITRTVFSQEEKVAEISTRDERVTGAHVELINYGRIARHAAFLRMAEKGIGSKEISEHLSASPIFSGYPHMQAIVSGLKLYEAGEHFASTTILSIQIEGVLRHMCQTLGIPTNNGIKTDGTQGHNSIMFAGLLANLRKHVGENLYWYIHLTCCDPYGMRIRNEAAHARLSFEAQEDNAEIIVHILILISGLALSAQPD